VFYTTLHLGTDPPPHSDDQMHGFIGFFDPQNLGKDTKIISLSHFVQKLWMIFSRPY